ncbi:MAG: hypothetical protein KF870_07375 [Leadbetterella sp.]|nr:hypothetical protein [Leadbetterella sp.]
MKKTTIESAIKELDEMWGIDGLCEMITENQEIIRMLGAASMTFNEIEYTLIHSRLPPESQIKSVKESIYYLESLFPDPQRFCTIGYWMQQVNSLLMAIMLHWKEQETEQEHIENPKAA